MLKVLDDVAAAHEATVAAVALAWLLTRPRVAAPIASARTTQQLDQILPTACRPSRARRESGTLAGP